MARLRNPGLCRGQLTAYVNCRRSSLACLKTSGLCSALVLVSSSEVQRLHEKEGSKL